MVLGEQPVLLHRGVTEVMGEMQRIWFVQNGSEDMNWEPNGSQNRHHEKNLLDKSQAGPKGVHVLFLIFDDKAYVL